jgi:hypothetical protein
MGKNMNYTIVFSRRSQFKMMLYSVFITLCSWPRMVIEVFLRTRFGERYFSFSGTVFLTIILALVPVIAATSTHLFRGDWGAAKFIWTYLTWYLFLAAFMYMSLQRRDEIKRLPSVFDFARYSLSSGVIDPRLFKIKIFGRYPTVRQVSMIIEPGLFFVVGVVLAFLGQALGPLFIQCSIWYALSYKAAFYMADEQVMDQIDKIIVQQEWGRSFVEGLDASETRGFSFNGRRPADPEYRKRVADAFMGKEETVEAF